MGVPTAFCLLGILTCSFFLGAKADGCLKGWKEDQGQCYRFINKPMTWFRAEVFCQNDFVRSTHLVSVLSADETEFVSKYIKKKQKDKSNVWIGLQVEDRNKWKWADLFTYKYKAWKTNEPDKLDKDQCVALSSDSDFKQWIPVPCKDSNTFICKYT